MILKAYHISIFSTCLFLFTPVLWAQEIKGKTSYISDGDTFRFVSEEGLKLKVRVADIDCPEKLQPFGLEAKEFVINQILNKDITLQVIATDRYGRKVARVFYDCKDLSEELLKNGFAWHFIKYSKDPTLSAFEQWAREKKLGLWSVANPEAPWVFRKKKKKIFPVK